jgi:hypothetical protein
MLGVFVKPAHLYESEDSPLALRQAFYSFAVILYKLNTEDDAVSA